MFFTYLYYTTWAGLPAAAALVPTVLHPTAHDEPPIDLDLFRTMFRHPAAFAFLTEEELDWSSGRFPLGVPPRSSASASSSTHGGDGGAAFRAAYGLGDRPYLAFVGRVDPAKGRRSCSSSSPPTRSGAPGPLALAVVGDPVRPLERAPRRDPDRVRRARR